MTYNYTTGHWYCCGADCNKPAGTDPYFAPPPESLYASASVGPSNVFFPIQTPVTAAHAVIYTSLTYNPTTSSTAPVTVTATAQPRVPASVARVSTSVSKTPAGVGAGLGLTTSIALVAMAPLALFVRRYRSMSKELMRSRGAPKSGWCEKGTACVFSVV